MIRQRSGKKKSLSVTLGFGKKKKSKCHPFFSQILIISESRTGTIFLRSVQYFIWLCAEYVWFLRAYDHFKVPKSHIVGKISPFWFSMQNWNFLINQNIFTTNRTMNMGDHSKWSPNFSSTLQFFGLVYPPLYCVQFYSRWYIFNFLPKFTYLVNSNSTRRMRAELSICMRYSSGRYIIMTVNHSVLQKQKLKIFHAHNFCKSGV